MLPVEPQFDVQAAMNHLIQFDPRFKGLFDAMKCRPFVEPFEALDPYRTLTTSIVGQQVSSTIHDEHSSLSGQLDGS
jgi:DNA-3-methyladenine glycosylase II